MKVLFLQLVPNVGHQWEIKDVSDSYARNFLIPKGFAKRLTPQEEKDLKRQEKQKEQKRRETVQNKQQILDALSGKTLIFQAQTHANGKMFGGIGEHDILQKIAKEHDITLEKKHIVMMDGHIKKTGTFDVYVKIGETMTKIFVTVQ